MSPGTEAAAMWTEKVDRDIETLIRGGQPANEDLLPLASFVEAMNSLAATTPSEGFNDTHAESAGELVRTRRESQRSASTPEQNVPWRWRVRNRATALTSSVLLVGGMTGMAWAAEGAAPGDWNYPVTRVLEAMGIGPASADQRPENPRPPDVAQSFHTESADRIGPQGSGPNEIGNDKVPAGAAALHDYIESSEHTEALTFAELARLVADLNQRDVGRPDDPGQPLNAGRPDSPGRPDGPGRPDSPGKP